jgi:hypothetical protein
VKPTSLGLPSIKNHHSAQTLATGMKELASPGATLYLPVMGRARDGFKTAGSRGQRRSCAIA